MSRQNTAPLSHPEDSRLLTAHEVAQLVGRSYRTFLDKHRKGLLKDFPRPVESDDRRLMWRYCDVMEWCRSRPDATGPSERTEQERELLRERARLGAAARWQGHIKGARGRSGSGARSKKANSSTRGREK